MKSGRIIAVATVCVVGVAGVMYYSAMRGKAPEASPSSSPSVKVTQMEPPQEKRVPSEAELREMAKTHVGAIQDVARRADAVSEVLVSGTYEEGETTEAKAAAKELAELENSLQDSMATLTQQLLTQPELTTNAIAMLQDETDPETMLMIARAIGEAAPILRGRFPADLLLKMAEKDASPQRRQAALLALSFLTPIPPDVESRVSELSQTASVVDVRVSAINCMGTWMSRDRDLTQRISEALLPAREASQEPVVRGMVIQTIGNMDTPLTPKVLEAMADAVTRETEATNRSLAAVALGSGASPENRQAVVSVLENAYLTEAEIDTKRHILTQIIKATRDTEVLKRLPTPDPLLAQDVNDYIEILASVDRNDWTKIWEQKSDRDDRRQTYPGSQVDQHN